jgi:SAM-dependent methyltransferase
LGHPNHRIFLKTFVPASPGRILEVGSKQYGSTEDFRTMYGGDYVGLDMEAGDGVDVVHDLTQGLGPLEPHSFDLVICCSVLEHVRKPWVMAEHLTELLKPGGLLYLAVPWVWRKHNYPDDYYRFSWRGVECLFDRLKWERFHYSTNKTGDFCVAAENKDNERRIHQGAVKYLPYLEIHGLGRLNELG